MVDERSKPSSMSTTTTTVYISDQILTSSAACNASSSSSLLGLSEELSLLYSQGYMTDITLSTDDGKNFEAHRILLAARSTYFHSLLPTLKADPVIFLKGINGCLLDKILRFMYGGTIGVHRSQIKSLIDVAKSLKVKGLQDITVREALNLKSASPASLLNRGGGGGSLNNSSPSHISSSTTGVVSSSSGKVNDSNVAASSTSTTNQRRRQSNDSDLESDSDLDSCSGGSELEIDTTSTSSRKEGGSNSKSPMVGLVGTKTVRAIEDISDDDTNHHQQNNNLISPPKSSPASLQVIPSSSVIQVRCKELTGELHCNRYKNAVRGECILINDLQIWVTPQQFENRCGVAINSGGGNGVKKVMESIQTDFGSSLRSFVSSGKLKSMQDSMNVGSSSSLKRKCLGSNVNMKLEMSSTQLSSEDHLNNSTSTMVYVPPSMDNISSPNSSSVLKLKHSPFQSPSSSSSTTSKMVAGGQAMAIHKKVKKEKKSKKSKKDKKHRGGGGASTSSIGGSKKAKIKNLLQNGTSTLNFAPLTSNSSSSGFNQEQQPNIPFGSQGGPVFVGGGGNGNNSGTTGNNNTLFNQQPISIVQKTVQASDNSNTSHMIFQPPPTHHHSSPYVVTSEGGNTSASSSSSLVPLMPHHMTTGGANSFHKGGGVYNHVDNEMSTGNGASNDASSSTILHSHHHHHMIPHDPDPLRLSSSTPFLSSGPPTGPPSAIQFPNSIHHLPFSHPMTPFHEPSQPTNNMTFVLMSPHPNSGFAAGGPAPATFDLGGGLNHPNQTPVYSNNFVLPFAAASNLQIANNQDLLGGGGGGGTTTTTFISPSFTPALPPPSSAAPVSFYNPPLESSVASSSSDIMNVRCRGLIGKLYCDLFESGSKGKCILFDATRQGCNSKPSTGSSPIDNLQWLTPNEFEEKSGSKAKKYLTSIKCLGFPLKHYVDTGRLKLVLSSVVVASSSTLSATTPSTLSSISKEGSVKNSNNGAKRRTSSELPFSREGEGQGLTSAVVETTATNIHPSGDVSSSSSSVVVNGIISP